MKKKAFTLIELLIVIAVIAILFIVILSKVNFASDRAKDSGVLTDFRSYQIGIQQTLRETGLDSSTDISEFNTALSKNLDAKMEFALNGSEYQSTTVNPYGYHYVLDKVGNELKIYSINKQGSIDTLGANNEVYAAGEYSKGQVLVTDLNTRSYDIGTFKDNTSVKYQTASEIGDNEEEPVVTKYTLNYTTDGNGTVNKTSETVNEGSNISVTATENSGYQFDKWVNSVGDTVSTNATLTINNVSASDTYTAHFKAVYTWRKYSATYIQQAGVVGGIAVNQYYTVSKNKNITVYATSNNPGTNQLLEVSGLTTLDSSALSGTWLKISDTTYWRILSMSQILSTTYKYNIYIYTLYGEDIYAKGTTDLGLVTSTDANAYPINGGKNGFWYVKQ